jgi:hypothetical protein
MNIISNNNREEVAIRIEVVRTEGLNKIETALVKHLAEMMSAILADKDDALVNIFGNGVSHVSEQLNMAMHMRDSMSIPKQHAPSKTVRVPQVKEKEGGEDKEAPPEDDKA